MQEFKQEERKVKEELTRKFKKKVDHLKNKYRNNKNEIQEEVPEDITEYSDARIFSKYKYDEIQEESYDIKIVGDVELTVAEKKVLKLHPKFCVVGHLKEPEFEHEQEAALAKVRMEVAKQEENQELTQEETQKMKISWQEQDKK